MIPIIPFDFDYYAPENIREAIDLHVTLTREGKQPLYLGGGTEIITLSRLNQIYTDAVIDIKDIPDSHVYHIDERYCTLGAAITLTELTERGSFPLLAETAGRIADHTTRNKITLAGNLCGEIIYKEAILPLLVTDSELVIINEKGIRIENIHSIFNKELNLLPHDFLCQIRTQSTYLNIPYYSVKKRKLEEIDYPLVTLVAIKLNGNIRFAVSGVCDFPFRSQQLEAILNQPTLSLNSRIEQITERLPGPILDDAQGSKDYRQFVFAETLNEAFTYLRGDSND